MAGAAEREAVKQRALIALEDARRALAGEMTHFRPYMHPGQLLKDSVRKHRIAYILGAAAAGFVALRVLLAPRAAAAQSTRGRLTGILTAALWPLVRGKDRARRGCPARDARGRCFLPGDATFEHHPLVCPYDE